MLITSLFFFLIPQLHVAPPLTHAPGGDQDCRKWGAAAWGLGGL